MSSAQRGQIFRKPSGLWAIRYRDGRGQRHQRTGYRTKGEAREALEELLRRVRLGPLHRPHVTLRQLYAAYVEQYDAAPATIDWLRNSIAPALERFGDAPIGSIAVDEVAGWRASLPEAARHRSHRALRQVLQAAVRWKWIEENVAVHVRNPAPRPGEIHPFQTWEEIDAICAEMDLIGGPLVVFLVGTGARPEEAFGAEWRDVDLGRRVFTVRRAFAKGRLKDFAKTTGFASGRPAALARRDGARAAPPSSRDPLPRRGGRSG